jgi:hypothetical protein
MTHSSVQALIDLQQRDENERRSELKRRDDAERERVILELDVLSGFVPPKTAALLRRAGALLAATQAAQKASTS